MVRPGVQGRLGQTEHGLLEQGWRSWREHSLRTRQTCAARLVTLKVSSWGSRATTQGGVPVAFTVTSMTQRSRGVFRSVHQ